MLRDLRNHPLALDAECRMQNTECWDAWEDELELGAKTSEILDSGRPRRTWPMVLKDLFEPYGGLIETNGNPGFWEASEDLADGVKGPF